MARLATAHTVFVGALIGRELFSRIEGGLGLRPERKSPHRASTYYFRPTLHTLNGVAERSRRWIEVLESTTLLQGLSALTLLPFRGVIDGRHLLRTERAWCPHCYEEQRATGAAVYDTLLWAIQTVTHCPQHQQRLRSWCPHCNERLPALDPHFRPGYCSQCSNWLGQQLGADGDGRARCLAHLDYYFWVANTIGDLLAAAPRLQPQVLGDNFRRNLGYYVNRLADGKKALFADYVELPRNEISDWLAGTGIPRIDSLLRICYYVGSSMLTLIGTVDSFDVKIEEAAHVQSTGKGGTS